MDSTFSEIRQYLHAHGVTLVAVSKTRPVDALMVLYSEGQRDFGENRVQEMREKQEIMPKDIRWHLIGHLQRNKVKYIAQWVYMIHSIDSIELLEEVNRQAAKYDRVIPCLLQMYVASEETKFGMTEQELSALLESDTFRSMRHIAIHGLMGMATNTEDTIQVRSEFHALKQIFERTRTNYFSGDARFSHLSMGMSADYHIAVEEGSTMVRIGSLLFE